MTQAQLSERARRFMKPSEIAPEFSSLRNTTTLSIYSPKISVEAKKLFETRQILNKQASILNENRIVVYKKGRQLGEGYFIVEISSDRNCLYITTFNVEKSQSILLEIRGS
jgi:hypothetical protein